MGSGKRYENDLITTLGQETPDTLHVYPCGYSGSHALPQPDVHIYDERDDGAYDVEIKHAQTDYATVPHDDFAQLERCATDSVSVWVAVKFSRRQLWVGEALTLWDEPTVVAPDPMDPRITDTGLRLTKPDTDAYPSAQSAPPDWQVLATVLGVP